MTALDATSLERAFAERPDIQAAIKQASTAGANWIELFNQITQHVCTLRVAAAAGSPSREESPPAKKRRLDGAHTNGTSGSNGAGTNGRNTTIAAGGSGGKAAPLIVGTAAAPRATGDTQEDPTTTTTGPVQLEIREVSVVVPQRKKYSLCFTASHVYARLPDAEGPVAGMVYAYADLDHVFFLPVPEKAQKQYNFVLLRRPKTTPEAQASADPLVFTVPATAPKPNTVGGPLARDAAAVSDSYETLLHWALSHFLAGAVKIQAADAKVFASGVKQPHRPGEPAVHVKAFRGSKDGYLFFLPAGILWGFKKPLRWIAMDQIEGVVFASVLQRTFNLVVEVAVGKEESNGPSQDDAEVANTEELEFSMIDQEDYGAIEQYVNRHGLQDRSMAEQRRAKRLGINAKKGQNGERTDDGEGEGELSKAMEETEQEREHRLQDEEDEDEEDYDPGSEGESEGEGTSSGEEGGEHGDDAEEEEEDAEDSD